MVGSTYRPRLSETSTDCCDRLALRRSPGGRIQRTNGWRQFAMYRAATQSGTLSVIFALSGLGEARIDNVAIEVLQKPALTPAR